MFFLEDLDGFDTKSLCINVQKIFGNPIKATLPKLGHNFDRNPGDCFLRADNTNNKSTQEKQTMDTMDTLNTIANTTEPSLAIVVNAPASWKADLRKHEKLTEDSAAIVAAQTKLMERDRLSKRTTRELESSSSGNGIVVSMDKSFDVELADLDQRLAVVESEMREIEARVLTHVPENSEDVDALLKFLSVILANGSPIDPAYLADVLSDCAEVRN